MIESPEIKTAQPKPFAFVAMPFSKSFDDLYEKGIRIACERARVYCERVDEQHYDGTIIDRIFNQIAKADVVICELSGRNPNVFYETGYAHALGKKSLLLASSAQDIPFDLQSFPIVVYGGSLETLVRLLAPKIEWAIQQDASAFYDPLTAIKMFVDGNDISSTPLVSVNTSEVYSDESLFRMEPISSSVVLQIDFHNSLQRVVSLDGLEVHLTLPNSISASLKERYHRRQDGSVTVVKKLGGDILPAGWTSEQLVLERRNLVRKALGRHQLLVELVSQFGRIKSQIIVEIA